MVWFFLETEPAFCKTQGPHFIHERVSRPFYNFLKICDGQLLRLDPCNANMRAGNFEKLLLRMICLDNHFHFQVFKNLTEFLKTTSLSTILQF